MNAFIIAAMTVGITATISILHFCSCLFCEWRRVVHLKQNGIETDADILHVEIINEEGRYLPFVRLKVQITTSTGSFIAAIDTHVTPPQLQQLLAGNTVRVVFNPHNINKVFMLSAPASIKPEYEASVPSTVSRLLLS